METWYRLKKVEEVVRFYLNDNVNVGDIFVYIGLNRFRCIYTNEIIKVSETGIYYIFELNGEL